MTEAPVKHDALVLSLLEQEALELYCDLVGQPSIHLPCTDGQVSDESWGLRSERVRAWIATFAWERLKQILLDREIDRILNVLEGRAWRNRRIDIELYEAIEHEPVLEALLLLLQKEARYEGTMTQLMQQLVKTARRAGLDVKARSWPKGTPQLSSRIRQLEPLLAKAQIKVERHRDGFQRRITLQRQTNDAAASPPSQASSIDKSHHPTNLRHVDAMDPEKRASIFARIHQPEEKGEP
jgi:hypothetical protein